ncbi:hypothetical protein Tco_0850731 [Tanacetum coccineum]
MKSVDHRSVVTATLLISSLIILSLLVHDTKAEVITLTEAHLLDKGRIWKDKEGEMNRGFCEVDVGLINLFVLKLRLDPTPRSSSSITVKKLLDFELLLYINTLTKED